MSTIISFFGGPGVGKSTSAASVYADMKQRGLSVELVREVVKDWAWEGRKITSFSQYYTTAKQIMKESLLLGKVDWIVTDSPPLLGIAYAEKYYSKNIARTLKNAVYGYIDEAESLGHTFINILLARSKGYDSAGRWEDEETAKDLDVRIAKLLFCEGISPKGITPTASSLKALVDELVSK